ncbi:hypothetical protein BX666DRAFT_2046446 [Dichotomocladium elegans]|nr:hypothetical protein BX666DRAFT_2046446 [Dichotomocladium elegans]
MSFVRSRRRGRVPHELDSNSEDETEVVTSDQDISSDHYDDSDDDDDDEYDDDDDETSEDENESTDNEEDGSEYEREGEPDTMVTAAVATAAAVAPSSSLEKESLPGPTPAKTTTSAVPNDERKEGGGGEKSELTEREKQILQQHENRRRQAATKNLTSAPDVGPSFEPYAGQFWDHDNRYRQQTALPKGTAEDSQDQHGLLPSDAPLVTATAGAGTPSGTGSTAAAAADAAADAGAGAGGSAPASKTRMAATQGSHQLLSMPPPRRRRQNNFRRVPEELLNNRWTHDGFEELMRLEEREEREGHVHKAPLPPVRQGRGHNRPPPARKHAQSRRANTKRIDGASKEWQMLDNKEGAWPALPTNVDSNEGDKSVGAGIRAVDGDADNKDQAVKEQSDVAGNDSLSSSSRQQQLYDADETLDWSETGRWSASKTDDSLAASLKIDKPSAQKNDAGARETSGWSSATAPVVENGGDHERKEEAGWGKPVEGNKDSAGWGDDNKTSSAPSVGTSGPGPAGDKDGWSIETNQQHAEDDWKTAAQANWGQPGDEQASAARNTLARDRTTRRDGGGQENPGRFRTQQQKQGARGERTFSKRRKEAPQGEHAYRTSKEEGQDDDWKKAATWATDTEVWRSGTGAATTKGEWSVESKELLAPVKQQQQQNKRTTTRGYLSQKKPSSLAAPARSKPEAPAATTVDAPTGIKPTEKEDAEPKPPAQSSFSYSFDAEPWKPSTAPRDDARGHERFIEEQEEQESDVEIILEADAPGSGGQSDGGSFYYPPQQQMSYMAMSGAAPPFAMPMQALPIQVSSEASLRSNHSGAEQENQYLPSSYEANGMVYYSMDPSAVYPYYYYAPMPVMVPAGHMQPNTSEDPDEGWGPVPDGSINEADSDWQTDKRNRNNQRPNQSQAYGGPFYYYPSSQYYT